MQKGLINLTEDSDTGLIDMKVGEAPVCTITSNNNYNILLSKYNHLTSLNQRETSRSK